MNKNLLSAVEELQKSSEVKKIYGSLGIPIGGQRLVEVANREGFVYVRLRDNQNEVIQALNTKVSPVYDLPVVLVRQGNRYVIDGRDTERYQQWGSFSSFLPRHGDQHSFNENVGGGGDITWVNGKQFMPLLVMPSGTFGANNVIVSDYRIQDGSSGWIYSGGTGTPNLLIYKPTDGNAVMILVYVDQTTGNPGFLVGSGSYFSNTITGSAQVNPHIPPNSNSNYLPAMAVRLTSGTSVIGWDNLYDVRQYYGGSGAESSGGLGGISVQDEGIPKGTGTVFNFVGPNVDVSVSGSVVRVFVTGSSGGSSLPPFITGSVPYAGSDGILKERNPQFSFDETNNVLWIGTKYNIPVNNDIRLIIRATGTNTVAGMALVAAGTGTSGGASPTYIGYKSRGTFESPAPVGEEDSLLTLIGAGYDGTAFRNAARIRLTANRNFITGSNYETRIDFGVTPSGSSTRIEKMVLYGDSLNLINTGTYNVNGVPHSHVSDGWTQDYNTWTFKNRAQAYTNDPAAGTGITLNMTNTADFVVGADVTVSSSAGSEDTIVTAVVANTSITVNQLQLNHTTTSPLVTLKDCFTINADVTSYIRKGTYLKFTQTTVKYGVVYTSTFSGGATTIVLITNTDYPLANAAISATYYSNTTYPDGWPVWFNYDPEPLGWSTVPSVNIVYEYMTIGGLMTISINQPSSSGGVTSNATTMKFSAPCLTVASTVVAMGQAMDNGSLLTGAAKARTGQTGFDRVIDCYTNMAQGTWTASGVKRVIFLLPFAKF